MKSKFLFFITILKSLHFAIALLVYIIFCSLLASLVPQNLDSAFYQQKYPEILTRLLLSVGFDHYFTSFFFIGPIIVFSLNLFLCTINRFIKQIKRKNWKDFGPDLIHFSLLIMLIGGLIGIFQREEQLVWFKNGDTLHISKEYQIKIQKIEFQKYADGRPRDWLTTLEIYKNQNFVRIQQVEVNRPLKIGEITIYQHSFNAEYQVILQDQQHNQSTIRTGQGLKKGNILILLHEILDNQIILHQWEDNKLIKKIFLQRGDDFEDYQIIDYSIEYLSGLKLVSDQSVGLVWLGIFIMILGFCWTYWRKFWYLVKKE
ncbi:MAG: cytochrome c biogenesis protein ResB [Spirochaetes bacterium]|nr:cytochrome c biogenesis protein ResB [Spirochaetota bacterium]